MEMHDLRQLPVRLEIAPTESGLGFALRVLRANGVKFDQGMRWLGLERHRPLDRHAVRRIAWALNVDPDQFGARMVTPDPDGGKGWVRLGGMRFRRQVATNKLYAKVCPQCLHDHGLTRLSWQLRAAAGCSLHGYSLISSCPHCGQMISWNRPDIDICQCGRYIKAQASAPLEQGVQAWLCWLESTLSPGSALPSPPLLPAALPHLSIDGAFRIVEALGLCASPAQSRRWALSACRSPRDVGAVIERGLNRLLEIADDPQVLIRIAHFVDQPTLIRIAADAAAPEDQALAWWLIQCMRYGLDSGNARVGGWRHGQLPLFVA